MRTFRNHLLTSIALLVFWTIQPCSSAALAQRQAASLVADPPIALAHSAPADERNYDVQIYLMVGSNEATGDRVALPQTLDAVVRQLRGSLPFSSYRLAATFLNRVTNGGSLQVNGVAGSLFNASPVPSSPTFYEFALSDISGEAASAGPSVVQISKFRFTMRLPLALSSTAGPGNTNAPVISYEPTGINTRVSVNEATPTLIGTMTTGRSDESYILIVNVRPAGR